MSRGPATFKQADVTRAVRGTVAAGVEVQRIEIDQSGKIVVVAGKPERVPVSNINDWDEVLHGDG